MYIGKIPGILPEKKNKQQTYPALMPKLTEPAKIGDLSVDVLLETETNFDSEVTENPVEDGSIIADHVQRKPMSLKMQVVFTPTPISFGTVDNNRLQNVANSLMKIYLNREPITIKTVDSIYNNMVMVRAPLPKTVKNGICYKMELEFKYVQIVTQRTEDIPEEYANNDAQGKAGTTEKDGGTATQSNLGTGMTTIQNTSTVKVNTIQADYSVAGEIQTGLEVSVNIAINTIISSLL